MPPSYEQCRAALQAVGADLDAAECHGLLSGMLCVPGAFKRGTFLAEVLGDDADAHRAGDCRRLLAALGEEVLRRLSSPDCDFAPLLPDDGQSLAIRAAALGSWCAGFLYGLGISGVARDRALSAEARELMTDLAGMTRIETDGAAHEDDEANYAELVEYVRVGVMLVYAELNGAAEPGRGAVPPLH